MRKTRRALSERSGASRSSLPGGRRVRRALPTAGWLAQAGVVEVLEPRLLLSAQLVSQAAAGGVGDRFSHRQMVSRDGQQIVFNSASDNLVSGQVDGQFDFTTIGEIFVRGTATTLVSHRFNNAAQTANRNSDFPAISGDGQFIAYFSDSSDVISVAPADEFTFDNDIYLYDRQANTSTLISRATDGSPAGGARSGLPSISDDGRFVVYESFATDLVAGQNTPQGQANVFLYDRVSNTNTLVSHAAGGNNTGGDGMLATGPVISADGEWVAFLSDSTNHVAGQSDANNGVDVFLYERATGAIALVSRAAGSATSAANHEVSIDELSISDDGRIVAYISAATNVIAGQVDSGGSSDQDAFAFDRVTGQSVLVSHAAGSAVTAVNGSTGNVAVSGDGQWIAYDSLADNIVAGQTAVDGGSNVFLFELATGAGTLVSHAAGNPLTSGTGSSVSPSISDGGRYIAFLSDTSNLVAGGIDTNDDADIFLWDRQTNTTILVSRQMNTQTTAGNNRSEAPQLSDDGSTVVFNSFSSDLVANDGNNTSDVFSFANPGPADVPVGTDNDPPVHVVPAGQQLGLEDAGFEFSGLLGRAITISDPQDMNDVYSVSLTATNGTLVLGGVAGLAFTAGADGTAAMTFTGTLAAINAAFDGLQVAPAPDYNGPASLRIVTSDQAHGGRFAAAAQDDDTIDLHFSAVNDAPSFVAANPPNANSAVPVNIVNGFIQQFIPGPPDEATQQVAGYTVSNVSNPALFASLPTIDNAGNLSYTLAAGAMGTVTFDVVVRDTGGIENGGIDTSAAQTFTLIIIDPASLAPEIDVRFGDEAVVDGDDTPGALDGTDFGNVSLAAAAVQHVFTIRNTGDAALDLTGAPLVAVEGSHAGDFTVAVQPGAAMIAPGGDVMFTLSFLPTAEGLRQATVTIANNDGDENPYTFAVQGNGVTRIPVGQVGGGSAAKGTFTDAFGNTFTFAIGGGGAATIVQEADGRLSVELSQTNAGTTLTIAPSKEGDHTLHSLTADGPMNSVAAKGVHFLGDILIAGGVASFTAGDVADQHIVSFGGAATDKPSKLVFGNLTDVTMTSGAPVDLTVTRWTDSDQQVNPDSLTAPYAAKIAVTGDKKAGTSAAFEADINLSGQGAAKQTLGSFSAAAVSGAAFNITGDVGSIALSGTISDVTIVLNGTPAGKQALGKFTVAGNATNLTAAITGNVGTIDLSKGTISNLNLTVNSELKTLKLGDIVQAVVEADLLGAVSAVRWQTGGLIAAAVTSLATSGNAKAGVPGDMLADVGITGDGDAGTLELGKATIKGSLGGTWNVAGSAGAIAADSVAPGFAATFAGDLKSLSSKAGFGGLLAAATIGKFDVKGSVVDAAIVAGSPDGSAIGTVNSIASFKVGGAFTNSMVKLGARPGGDGLFNTADDGFVLDPLNLLKSLTIGGMAEPADQQLFSAGAFPITVSINKQKINVPTDPRFGGVPPAP